MTPNDVARNLNSQGEVLFISRPIAETITTMKRYEAFRFWSHALLLRRQTGAAEFAGSAGHVINLYEETSDLKIRERCDELLTEVNSNCVARYPQRAS